MIRRVQGTALRLLTLLAACSLLAPSLANAQRVEYYHVDALGSVRAVTDENGDVVERHDYLPFGEEWNAEPSSQPRKFTGKERDAETGWDYFGARYYEASLARFTSIDPVTTFDENRADPQRWNRYAYVRNNPLRYVDPDGRAINVAAILALGWAAFEIGSQIYDAYSTIETLADPNASAGDKALVTGTFVAGAIAPGGGYSSAAKASLQKADDAVDLAQGLARGTSGSGVVTREGRLRQLVDDASVSSADRGWIRNEMRQVRSGNRSTLRNPPGRDLRHPAGRARAQGYDYSETSLQDRASHRSQHRYLVERSTGTGVRIPRTPPKPGPELPK